MKFWSKCIFFIQEHSFENVVWKMAAILSQSQCVNWSLQRRGFVIHPTETCLSLCGLPVRPPVHTMNMLWEKFQWILPLYMKPISFPSKASVVCSVTTAVFVDFCLKKLNVFSQHFGKKNPNKYLNSAEQILRIWNVDRFSVLITSRDILNDAASTYCEKS